MEPFMLVVYLCLFFAVGELAGRAWLRLIRRRPAVGRRR